MLEMLSPGTKGSYIPGFTAGQFQMDTDANELQGIVHYLLHCGLNNQPEIRFLSFI